MITVQLTEQEHELFTLLQDSGVFQVRNGVATLNFDSSGTITDIDCNFKLFKRGKPIATCLHVVV